MAGKLFSVVVDPVSYYFYSGTHCYKISPDKIEEVMAFLDSVGEHIPNVATGDSFEESSKETSSIQEDL